MRTKICIAFVALFCWTSVFSQSNKLYIYETNDYKIEFPSEPKKMTQAVPSALGELLMTIASYEPNASSQDNNYVYMIMESKYPCKLPQISAI